MHTHAPAHFLVLQMSSHLCHRAGRPNLCHTHTSRVQCKCHDHTQETSRTHHTDHPSSHNDTYRDRERLQQWESEKKTENKSKRILQCIWHASALCGACRHGVIFLKPGQTHLHSPGTSQEPWATWHLCLHTAIKTHIEGLFRYDDQNDPLQSSNKCSGSFS